MPVSVHDSLPPALAARLTDDQRVAILEAPRDKRLLALATALQLTEAAALPLLAQAAGLEIASNLEADPVARSLLPARKYISPHPPTGRIIRPSRSTRGRRPVAT